MKKLSILFLIIFQSVAHAQFSNVWDSWQHPRQDGEKVRQLTEAHIERYNIDRFGIDIVSPYVPYRSTRTKLIELKQGWGTTFWYLGTSNSLPTFYTGEIGPFVRPNFGLPKSDWAAYLNLPTNYFSYTPRRCLSGLGPFFDDASVGHGHGWTNSYTEAGGTNFPAGRSTWYTTDYGFQGMRDLHAIWTITDVPNIWWGWGLDETNKLEQFFSGAGGNLVGGPTPAAGDVNWVNTSAEMVGKWNNPANWVAVAGPRSMSVNGLSFESYGSGGSTHYYVGAGFGFGHGFEASKPAVVLGFGATSNQVSEGCTFYWYGRWWNPNGPVNTDYLGQGASRYSAIHTNTPLWDSFVIPDGTQLADFPLDVGGILEGKIITLPAVPTDTYRSQEYEYGGRIMDYNFEWK